MVAFAPRNLGELDSEQWILNGPAQIVYPEAVMCSGGRWPVDGWWLITCVYGAVEAAVFGRYLASRWNCVADFCSSLRCMEFIDRVIASARLDPRYQMATGACVTSHFSSCSVSQSIPVCHQL